MNKREVLLKVKQALEMSNLFSDIQFEISVDNEFIIAYKGSESRAGIGEDSIDVSPNGTATPIFDLVLFDSSEE